VTLSQKYICAWCALAGRAPAKISRNIYNGVRAWQKSSQWHLNPCDFKDLDISGSTRAWRTNWTCAVTRRRAGLNHLSQCLRHWLPARDNQASGKGDKPFCSLQNPTLHERRHALREPLHISILAAHDTPVWERWITWTKYNTNLDPQS